ncbi:MAG: TIGR04282 family arsenosugar biosynthesis glycosyltransferase [Saprospiraceae bacterium]|nr:TIGR04282 family arsenosugar biosynthesis glycosyltransferase [Saprospiraceae bacterium]
MDPDFSSNDPALIIFIKNPRMGQVKTRLAATMGDAMALRIYLALTERIRRTTTPLPYTKYLYYSDFVDEADEWPAAQFVKKLQYKGDLGERMSHAFAEVLERHGQALIVGSDVPGINAEIINAAFDELNTHDFAIGGTDDGGYYLLGMNAHEPAVFQGIDWSTETVFSQTQAAIAQLGKTCAQVAVLPDIDFEEDWQQHGWQL